METREIRTDVGLMFRARWWRQPTAIWALLIGVTVVTTWVLSKNAFSAGVGSVATLLLAAWKVRLVLLDYMELRHAPIPMRIAFEIWAVAVTGMLIGFYLAT